MLHAVVKKLRLPGLLTCAFLPALANAHGWVEFPEARQSICYEDGGFWSADGQDIPNAACKAAFDISGTYPFVQRNEVAMLVKDFRNMAEVKRHIPDGTLCSAGTEAKAGLNVPSSQWQKTRITLDNNNQIELLFNATAPHNPSFWEFYLTKPDYDHSQALTWNDLELVATAGNVAVDSDRKYRINITLPADRKGDAILYTRWQRDDPAGEGFYNCSDITFTTDGDSGGGTDPAPETPEFTSLGYYIPQGFPTPGLDDYISFRGFDNHGQEVLEERILITHQNRDRWPELLALQVSDKHKAFTIGIWHEAMNHYMFDRENIYANQVWAQDPKASYALSLIPGDTIVPPPLPSGQWDSEKIYVEGDVVRHNEQNWLAHWWTQGDEPGTTGEWGVWRLTDLNPEEPEEPEVPETGESNWSNEQTYYDGDKVIHNSVQWRAHWWTKGDEPGTTGEWGVWRQAE